MSPVPELCGLTTILYVPLTGSAFRSRKSPEVPISVAGVRVEPSGFRIDTLELQQAEEPMVTSDKLRLTRLPAIPLNESLAFWPGETIETVWGAPPAVIVALTSAGTLCTLTVAFPVERVTGLRKTL